MPSWTIGKNQMPNGINCLFTRKKKRPKWAFSGLNNVLSLMKGKKRDNIY